MGQRECQIIDIGSGWGEGSVSSLTEGCDG